MKVVKGYQYRSGGVVWDMVWVVVASDWGMGGKELGNRGEWG